MISVRTRPFGTGDGIGERLRGKPAQSRQARLKFNQGVTCETCEAGEERQVAETVLPIVGGHNKKVFLTLN